MNKHGQMCYTYYLYHVPTGKKYYGSRVANRHSPEQDLWNEYFASSDLVDNLIKEYGKESFIPEVRKTFDTEQEARDWEDRVHHKLKVVEKEEWLNQAYAYGPFYCDWTGKERGESTRAKMRANRKKQIAPFTGRKHKEESKIKIGLGHKGEKSPNFGVPLTKEQKQNLREKNLGDKNPFYGKKHSEESKEINRQKHLEIWRKKKELGLVYKPHSKERIEKQKAGIREYWRKKKLGLL